MKRIDFCEDCEFHSKFPFLEAKCKIPYLQAPPYTHRTYKIVVEPCSLKRTAETCKDFKEKLFDFCY